ncbi:PAS domain S-box protein [Lutibacter sp. B2]|nr:PAS domain S-box protein [Lutibacter sp. B2]
MNEKKFQIKKYIWLILSMIMFSIVIVTYMNKIYMPTISGFFAIFVILSFYNVGNKIGWINVLIVSTYSLFSFWIHIDMLTKRPMGNHHIYFVFSLIEDIILFCIATLVGKLVNRNRIILDEFKESNEKYRTLVKNIPDAIVIHKNGIIKFVNHEAGKWLNIEDPIGKNIFDYIHPDYLELAKNNIKKSNEEECIFGPVEEKCILENKKEIPVEIIGVPLIYSGEKCIQVIVRDLSERKRGEEKEKLLLKAKEYDKMKNEFFANISHELRNPINVILGTLQVVCLDTEHIEEKHKRYINIMSQNCNRLLRLINNLIDNTKIEAGFLTLNKENVDIVNLVEEVTLSTVEYAKNKGVYVEFDTEVEEKIIACDPEKMDRILLNLLSNAVKFTDSGGKIKVNVYNEKEYVKISVKDTGRGISSEDKDLIFKRFHQVDHSLSKRNEGSGIGLSLVKSLIEMHDGKVYVESEYRKGSEFVLLIPDKKIGIENIQEVTDNIIEQVNIEFADIT